MAALLVSIAIMSVMMAVALPVWSHLMQREREEEWIFRAEQYARAVVLFQRQYPGAFPTSVDALVKQRFLRRKYTDPLSPDGEFRVVRPGQVLVPGQRLPRQPGRGASRQSPFGQLGQTLGPGQGGQLGGRLQSGGQRPGEPDARDEAGRPFRPGDDLDTAAQFVPGGIAGVSSKSTAESIRIFKGQTHYNEWVVTIEDVMPRFQLGSAPSSQSGQGGRTAPFGPGQQQPSPGRQPRPR